MQEFQAFCRENAQESRVHLMLTKTPVSVETAFLAAGSECISVGHKTEVTAETLEALKKMGVRFLCTRSIGYNHIDITAAKRLGIVVENVTYAPQGVADYTIMLMLMLQRKIVHILERSGRWDFRLGGFRGKELCGMSVGVIGTGNIGKAVVERLKGFGCQVFAYDLYQNTNAAYVTLEELLRKSDIVTLHTPLLDTTRHLLDEKHLAMMKPEAILINTGRGALIDTRALIGALEDGRISGAALDVVEGEDEFFYQDCQNRKRGDSYLARLTELPNVIITPHAAYYTEHVLLDTIKQTLDQCLEFEAHKMAAGM